MQQGFMMVPPWMMQQPQRPSGDDRVPRRIAAAFEAIELFNRKTATRIAANDMSITDFKGDELDVEEVKAFRAACNVLTQYLQGEYVQSAHEKAEAKAGSKNRHTIGCVRCGGNGMKSPTQPCPMCEGSGIIEVSPAK